MGAVELLCDPQSQMSQVSFRLASMSISRVASNPAEMGSKPRRLMTLLGLSVALLISLGCSDSGGVGPTSDGGAASSAGVGGTSASTTTPDNAGSAGAPTAAGSAGSSLGADTSSCAAWPRARLIPIIGPFFYGPDPGPCSTVDDDGRSTYTYQDGVLVSELYKADDGTIGNEVVITYGTDAQGRVTATSGVGSGDVYEFGTGTLLDTLTYQGTLLLQARYSLSSSGYPLSAIVAKPGQPSETLTYAYKSCRLVQRTTSEVATYTYDSAGHVVARSILMDGQAYTQTYDYGCW
jgi:hypothetical protein